MEQFMKEKFDFKRFFLLNIKRIWIVIVSTVLVAALFGGIYYADNVIFKSQDIYRVDSIYNIEFDMDLYGDTIQYYNDFTWNDVIDSDIIAGQVADDMALSKNYVYETTFVPTMSDIRIIHVYVDDTDKDKVVAISRGIGDKLSQFGSETPGFLSISKWSETEPYVVTKDLLTKRVTAIGAILGFVLGMMILMYRNAMDDSIYTLKDAETFAEVTPAGILTSGKDNSRKQELLAVLKNACNGNVLVSTPYEDKTEMPDVQNIITECGFGEIYSGIHDDEYYKKAKDADAVILVLRYGNSDGLLINSEVRKMNLLGINVKTSVIIDGDERFIRSYYKS